MSDDADCFFFYQATELNRMHRRFSRIFHFYRMDVLFFFFAQVFCTINTWLSYYICVCVSDPIPIRITMNFRISCASHKPQNTEPNNPEQIIPTIRLPLEKKCCANKDIRYYKLLFFILFPIHLLFHFISISNEAKCKAINNISTSLNALKWHIVFLNYMLIYS